ncbi:hypothetical protein C8F01DRAFT_618172 [Mycena amicta]|nr:hypothetical protein C8F01DRAFT_618172 [Mycena amicta]
MSDRIQVLQMHEAEICAQALQHSIAQNPRRLEAFGYTLNAINLRYICGDHSTVLMHNPQLPLWLSGHDFLPNASDPDSSIRSYHDSEAKGVFVDDALVIPHIQIKPAALQGCAEAFKAANITTTEDVIRMLASNSPHDQLKNLTFHLLDVVRLEAVLLVKSKCGPPRHFCDLAEYCTAAASLLNAAMAQAESQGACAFTCRRLAGQKEVLLIANSGPFWQVRLLHKDKDTSWKDTEYFMLLQTYADDLSDLIDNENKSVSPEMKAIVDFFASTTATPDPLPTPDITAIQTAERNQRATERTARQAAASNQTASDIGSTLPNADSWMQPFTDSDMDVYWESEMNKPFFEPPARTARLARGQWTRVMRYGTPVSDLYLEAVRQRCGKIAIKEEQRRKKKLRFKLESK